MNRIKRSAERITAYATVAMVVITMGAAIGAFLQLTEIQKTTKADFHYKMTRNFFTDQSRNLIMLFENNLLEFKELKIPSQNIDYVYFALNKERAKIFVNDSLNLLESTKDVYSQYEIDDLLLSPFDDLETYLLNKMINLEYAYSGFGWYVETIFENHEIQKYLKWMRSDKESKDEYKNVDDLYKKFKKYEK